MEGAYVKPLKTLKIESALKRDGLKAEFLNYFFQNTKMRDSIYLLADTFGVRFKGLMMDGGYVQKYITAMLPGLDTSSEFKITYLSTVSFEGGFLDMNRANEIKTYTSPDFIERLEKGRLSQEEVVRFLSAKKWKTFLEEAHVYSGEWDIKISAFEKAQPVYSISIEKQEQSTPFHRPLDMTGVEPEDTKRITRKITDVDLRPLSLETILEILERHKKSA